MKKRKPCKTRYLGSKARVVDQILAHVGRPNKDGVFVEPFCGTGVVSREASMRGWIVHASDHLQSCVVMTTGQLVAQSQVPFTTLGGYEAALSALNELPPKQGFIQREYSPLQGVPGGIGRRYFTTVNAGRIDAIRLGIQKWSDEGTTSELERDLLLSDLLSAANSVANTAGTYGCFLRNWSPASLRPLLLIPRELNPSTVEFSVRQQDVFQTTFPRSAVVYLDPPYTKRQYAAYYHILETIVEGDEPEVGGVTGLRPWKDKSSPFCFKQQALRSILKLVDGVSDARILISYSDQGHIDLDDLRAELLSRGTVESHTLGMIGKYRPNAPSSLNGKTVVEHLIEFHHNPTRLASAET